MLWSTVSAPHESSWASSIISRDNSTLLMILWWSAGTTIILKMMKAADHIHFQLFLRYTWYHRSEPWLLQVVYPEWSSWRVSYWYQWVSWSYPVWPTSIYRRLSLWARYLLAINAHPSLWLSEIAWSSSFIPKWRTDSVKCLENAPTIIQDTGSCHLWPSLLTREHSS